MKTRKTKTPYRNNTNMSLSKAIEWSRSFISQTHLNDITSYEIAKLCKGSSNMFELISNAFLYGYCMGFNARCKD